MKRIISALIVLSIAAVSLCSCSAGGGAASTEQITAQQQASAAQTTSPVDPVKKNKLMTYKIKLNGVSLTLPFNSTKLKKLGFEYRQEGTLDAKKFSAGVYPKNSDGKILSSQLWNPSDKPLEYKKCKIGQLKIGLGEGFELILPEGIRFDKNCTQELIKKTYGEPDSFIKGKNFYILKYKEDVYKFIEFFIYTDAKMQKYSSVTIENF